jgi:hypothetical protein
MGLDSPDNTKSSPSGALFWHDVIGRFEGWAERSDTRQLTFAKMMGFEGSTHPTPFNGF